MTRVLGMSLMNANIEAGRRGRSGRRAIRKNGGQVWEACAASHYGYFVLVQSERNETTVAFPLCINVPVPT